MEKNKIDEIFDFSFYKLMKNSNLKEIRIFFSEVNFNQIPFFVR